MRPIGSNVRSGSGLEWTVECQVRQFHLASGVRTESRSRFVYRKVYTRKDGSRYVMHGSDEPKRLPVVDHPVLNMPSYVIDYWRNIGISGAELAALLKSPLGTSTESQVMDVAESRVRETGSA